MFSVRFHEQNHPIYAQQNVRKGSKMAKNGQNSWSYFWPLYPLLSFMAKFTHFWTFLVCFGLFPTLGHFGHFRNFLSFSFFFVSNLLRLWYTLHHFVSTNDAKYSFFPTYWQLPLNSAGIKFQKSENSSTIISGMSRPSI